ncbi:hypothetical protein C7C46_18295 [Streptomyces tateyamensis]|uniref:Secreted protein n=1 Tax=Streptomyces tateyamensis TaxID=565073 RepID=A0A2V4N441_9ACTN|nr:hypothetical protein [Streptomyces tateyamensis]PYC77587.1 hypothetical protein C7C46_18295 [Streptomyces tateyamensis]
MADMVLNLVLGLLTSAIGAAVGWLVQFLRRRRRLDRLRTFFGMPGGSDCLLVVNRHVSANSGQSVHRSDVSALMELAVLVSSCGARPEIVSHDQVHEGLGEKAEFCLGGPHSNERAAAHLLWRLPNVTFQYAPGTWGSVTVGEDEYHGEPSSQTSPGWSYALLARLDPGAGRRPTFLILGQAAIANHAAVRFLVRRQHELMRRYGPHGSFVLMLRVINPGKYGPDEVELVADVTAAATTPAPSATSQSPAALAP